MVVYKKENTIGWTANQLQNIGSQKPALAKVAAAYRKNGGSTIKLYP